MTTPGAAAELPRLTWDLRLHKRLRHAGGDFLLDLVVQSDAGRLVLFGPSGAGKTLSLQLIAGGFLHNARMKRQRLQPWCWQSHLKGHHAVQAVHRHAHGHEFPVRAHHDESLQPGMP